MSCRDPSASLVADIAEAQPPESPAPTPVSGRQRAVLVATLLALALAVWGIKVHQWYFVELGGVFFALALATGLINGTGFDDMAKQFVAGAGELETVREADYRFLVNLREEAAANARIRFYAALRDARIARSNYDAATVNLDTLGIAEAASF